jgi:hypothetical protein
MNFWPPLPSDATSEIPVQIQKSIRDHLLSPWPATETHREIAVYPLGRYSNAVFTSLFNVGWDISLEQHKDGYPIFKVSRPKEIAEGRFPINEEKE